MNEVQKFIELVQRLPANEGSFATVKMILATLLPDDAVGRLAAVDERGGKAIKNASSSNAAVPALES